MGSRSAVVAFAVALWFDECSLAPRYRQKTFMGRAANPRGYGQDEEAVAHDGRQPESG